ncbi:hypothetical protein FRE64_05015 [Euhalothece natronophila Z-M001]|uniref:HetP family heterocyst commitment protein n=1 Tax=Euhalothece natronophila Z-M001 TaxID=522448 RepID=A0A5B8NJ86_9CHRO|nr:HetP family heterocyst commitment protein [Euhalothece natronophila]QDZ39343.1 hypothetical protein FRE64_05015 [Euhalothece natronophila Z-M001]
MKPQTYSSQNKADRVMSEKNFEKIIEAIALGKYSWACVLILQATGYNPLHYIPYRTYSRLIKMNAPTSKKKPTTSKQDCSIEDLDYLQENRKHKISGGNKTQYLNCSIYFHF